MPRKVFVAGEILTASDVNTNLMDQSVMVFDDATARSTAIPTPVEGMVTYLKDEDEVTVFDGSAFKAVGPGQILQVLFTSKTDTFSTASTTFTDVTGLSLTITPSAATSKIMIMAQVTAGAQDNNTGGGYAFRLNGGNSGAFVGDAAGSRTRGTMNRMANGGTPSYGPGRTNDIHTIVFLDSPTTASAVTYKVQMRANTGTAHVNRSGADTDDTFHNRGASSFTVMEVAG